MKKKNDTLTAVIVALLSLTVFISLLKKGWK